MPRPLQLEYENASYHMMNRDRSHQQEIKAINSHLDPLLIPVLGYLGMDRGQ